MLVQISKNSWQKNKYNPFPKNSSSGSTYTCNCNDPKYKSFIKNDHDYVITGNL